MQTSLDNRKMQVRRADQALYPIQSGSFVGRGPWLYATSPCIIIIVRKGEDRRKKKREVLHLFRCYTHTRPEPGQPWKARGRKKADTDDGQKAKTAQGGEGNRRTSETNLHGETDLTRTEHTPKPHDTLRRGTKGELGTKWGTSWWQTKETKTNSFKKQNSVLRNQKVVRYSPPGTWSGRARRHLTAVRVPKN